MRIAIDARKAGDFGIGTYIRGLLRGLMELDAGHQYVALAPSRSGIPDGVEHVEVDAPHYSLRELFVVGRAAERAGAQLLHAPHYVVPRTTLPLTVTIHDLIHLHQPMRNPLAPLYARAMLRRAVHGARRVLTVSNAVKRQLEDELGARHVVVTPNGVDMPASISRESASGAFLYVGNDKPHKGVDVLMDAFDQLQREMPEARLTLAGGAFERFRGRQGVELRGFVSDEELSRLYSRATALVMPSREEGFGLPAAEAMAHGAAVITSDAAALVEITGDAALHVPIGDAHSLAEAMRRVARQPSLRDALGARGLMRARSLTWKRCAQLTVDVWTSVLERGTSWNV